MEQDKLKNSSCKLKELASLLATVVGVAEKESVEETIQAAIDKLSHKKDAEEIVKTIKDDVKDKLNLNEDDIYMTSMSQPYPVDPYRGYIPLTPRIRKKFFGEPTVKSWAHIQKADFGLLQPTYRDNSDVGELTDEDYNWVYPDSSYDIENHITRQDIYNFLNNLTVSDYLKTLYDDDELVVIDDIEDYDYDDEFPDYNEELLAQELKEAQTQLDQAKTPKEIVEKLSVQQRLKRAMKMRAKAKRIAAKRAIALKKPATREKIERRARKMAIRMLKQKYAGGRQISDLSYAERDRIDQIIASKKELIKTLQKKFIPIIMKIEKTRLQHRQE